MYLDMVCTATLKDNSVTTLAYILRVTGTLPYVAYVLHIQDYVILWGCTFPRRKRNSN